MAFLCKKVSKHLGTGKSRADGKCKKAFRKDMTAYEEADEYCPHCDNQYVSWSISVIIETDTLLGDRSKRATGHDRSRGRRCKNGFKVCRISHLM
jgi:hypothetical protein